MIYESHRTNFIDLVVKQGDDYSKAFSVDEDGKALNANGAVFLFGARYTLKKPELDISLECNNKGGGVIELNIPQKITSTLEADNPDYKKNIMYYDVQMLKNGKATTIMQGYLFVDAGHAYRGNNE